MTHQCTSSCQKTKDCPLCPHEKDEDEFCTECDLCEMNPECKCDDCKKNNIKMD